MLTASAISANDLVLNPTTTRLSLAAIKSIGRAPSSSPPISAAKKAQLTARTMESLTVREGANFMADLD